MTPERFRQIEEVFHVTADAHDQERAAVLDRLCGDDAELRAEVVALLASLGGAATQIQGLIGREAAVAAREQAASIPRRIGPYRLEREIGHGGMGAVYLASRDDDEYRTRVAIKLLHHGLETADAVARFRDERQILASLEHPGIVRLLDGGSTEERLPYLVMEHVEGAPITLWAEARELDVRARLKPFLKVCAAVSYAHQKLVVHRDLKPSNILVTAEGEPKLLDFGIAKLLDPGAGREAETRTGMRLLTPEYASPEQVRGEPVSTASDVYALGAVLYELLSGAPAQRLEGEGLEALRALLEVDPPLPSLAAPAGRRRAIAGDLDNIVMKALQKEPSRRYLSVEQLAEDLGRHLDGLPVLARAGTWTYRAGKLLRRSRGVIAAAGIVLASLSTATAVSVRQARRADEQARRADEQARRAQKGFDDVRRLANSLLFEVDTKIASLEGSTEARELIVRRALEYLAGIERDAGGDPALLRELSTAYVKIGDIQGNGQVPNLGRPHDALESYRKAERIVDGLTAPGHADTAARWLLARALFGMVSVHRTLGEPGPARARGREALEVLATLPDDGAFDHRVAARGYAIMLSIAEEDGDAELVARHARACLDTATRWVRADASTEARYWIGIAHGMRSGALLSIGDPDSALPEARESTAILGAISAEEPANASYRRDLQRAHLQAAMCLSGMGDARIWLPGLGDPAAAERDLAAGLALVEEHARRDLSDTRATEEVIETLDDLASLVAERDPAAALRSFERARTLVAGLAPSVRTSFTRDDEWSGQCAMAVSLARLGRRADALAAAQTGLAVASTDAEAAGASFDARLAPWMCRYQTARARRALGDEAAAVELLEQTAAGLRPLLAPRPRALVPYIGLVDTLSLHAAMRPARRCALLDEAAAAWRSWPGAPTPYTQRRLAEIEAARAGCH